MTYTYWLGLNKLAEETVDDGAGRELDVFRPYSEEDVPNHNWAIFGYTGYQSIAYETEAARGKVLRLQSTAGTALGGTFVIGDHPDATGTGLNDNDDPWANGGRHHLGLWMRNGSALADKTVQITALVENTAGQVRQLSFATKAGTDGHSGSCVTDYIGTAYNDGQWHYLEFDLAERLFAIAGETLQAVDGIIIRCASLYVDDVVLSSGGLKCSWAQVLGAALGGYLGAQTGSAGANGVAAWGKYYYHFSDLGTVLATTDGSGALLGVYQPDFWGNYRQNYGTRPDTMGLTGKFYDEDADLYYFNARWYDPERGSFISITPIGTDLESEYGMNNRDPINFFDPNGKNAVLVGAIAGAGLGFLAGAGGDLPPEIITPTQYLCYLECMTGSGIITGAIAGAGGPLGNALGSGTAAAATGRFAAGCATWYTGNALMKYCRNHCGDPNYEKSCDKAYSDANKKCLEVANTVSPNNGMRGRMYSECMKIKYHPKRKGDDDTNPYLRWAVQFN